MECLLTEAVGVQFEQQKSEIILSIRKKQYDNLPDEVKRLFTIVKYGKDKVSTKNSAIPLPVSNLRATSQSQKPLPHGTHHTRTPAAART